VRGDRHRFERGTGRGREGARSGRTRLDAATNWPPGRNALPGEERAACLDEVRAVLEPKLRDAAGTWAADYVRLRFAATKLKSIAT
jgi:hypothetical protein